MHGFLAEHSIRRGGPFKPAAWSTPRLRPKLCGRYSQNILLRPLSKVSVTMPDSVMALYWLWLNQIYGTRPLRRRGKAVSVGGFGAGTKDTLASLGHDGGDESLLHPVSPQSLAPPRRGFLLAASVGGLVGFHLVRNSIALCGLSSLYDTVRTGFGDRC